MCVCVCVCVCVLELVCNGRGAGLRKVLRPGKSLAFIVRGEAEAGTVSLKRGRVCPPVHLTEALPGEGWGWERGRRSKAKGQVLALQFDQHSHFAQWLGPIRSLEVKASLENLHYIHFCLFWGSVGGTHLLLRDAHTHTHTHTHTCDH